MAGIAAHSVGVGLKPAHYRDALSPGDRDSSAGDDIGFFEVHAENYMGAGGPPHEWLSKIRDKYPLSVHGVCLSIGGASPLDEEHLARLRMLADRYEPSLVSEHLAWCAHDGSFFNDLIAPPLTKNSLARISDHVSTAQDALGKKIFIENPSHYLPINPEIPEPEFLNALAEKTGCGLLLDINNVFVSASNLGYSAKAYLEAVNADAVGEIHLAGHAVDEASGLLIDDHGSGVCDDVGALYSAFIARAGAKPTLVEWDTDTPDLARLCKHAKKARGWMNDALKKEADIAAVR